jgi:alpha-glucosidase
MQTADSTIAWANGADHGVLDFSRSGGWRSVTNFSETAIALPAGKILIASGVIADDGNLPPETTVWMLT